MQSKLFDKIRVKKRASSSGKPEDGSPRCAWKGCEEPGIHKAPKGPNTPGHHQFCLAHVREYNKNYDFFSDLGDDEIKDIVTDRSYGRPTWDTRAGKGGSVGADSSSRTKKKKRHDPSNVFARYARMQGKASGPNRSADRKILEADRKALEMLGVGPSDSADTIKLAYKDLVKKHHPDINGGNKSSEERLRNIITAYNHLKAKGFV